jgi:hypothetical protein
MFGFARILVTDGLHIIQHDQLRKARDAGRVFGDFNEGPIQFAPTYKYDLNTDVCVPLVVV